MNKFFQVVNANPIFFSGQKRFQMWKINFRIRLEIGNILAIVEETNNFVHYVWTFVCYIFSLIVTSYVRILRNKTSNYTWGSCPTMKYSSIAENSDCIVTKQIATNIIALTTTCFYIPFHTVSSMDLALTTLKLELETQTHSETSPNYCE